MLEFKRKQLLTTLSGLDCASRKRLTYYAKRLTTDKEQNLFDDRMRDTLLELAKQPELIKSEIKYLDEIGFTQSNYQYSQIKEQLDKFRGDSHPYYGWNKHFKQAKADMMKEFSSWNLKPLEYSRNTISEQIPKLNTHAGFSFITTGQRLKGEYVEGMFENYIKEEDQALRNGTFSKPILIGSRTTGSGAYNHTTGEKTYTCKHKTRLVSMIDIYQVMCERKFQRDVQGMMSNQRWYAGGKNDIDIGGIIHYNQQSFQNWISIDYSSFDQTISDWLIHEAFDVVRSSFSSMSERDERLFEIMKHDFISKMFISGCVEPIIVDKGVPSGSMFTQVIDSIVNRLMVLTYLNHLGVKRHDMMIMGDDNVIFTMEKIDKQDLESYLKHNFGIEANAAKCSEGDFSVPVEFLSRTWSDVIYRIPGLLIAKLCYPEHFREYDRLNEHPVTIIGQYIDNFPGGMVNLIDSSKYIRLKEIEGRPNSRKGDLFLTGLARYRAMFDRRQNL